MQLAIKPSPIAGNGVFTTGGIKKSQLIHVVTGELCTLEEVLHRVEMGVEAAADPLGVEEEKYLDLDELSRTFNHSCAPNAYIRGKNELMALRDIRSGEEITYDYSTTMNDNEEKIIKYGNEMWTCACHCGSADCRGIIDQFKNVPESTQKFYLRNRYAPDFILNEFS